MSGCQDKNVIDLGSSGGGLSLPVDAGFKQFTVPDDNTWHKYVRRSRAVNINIQNNDRRPIKINYDNAPSEPLPATWTGMLLEPGDERNYDSKHELWFKVEPGKGDVTLDIEELQGG